MFIRKYNTRNKKTGTVYTTYKLVRSIRTELGPRQEILLDLGDLSRLNNEELKDLANRIEQLWVGYETVLIEYPIELEELARTYADILKKKELIEGKGEEIKRSEEYKEIDLLSIDVESCRSIGGEYISHRTFHELRLPKILKALSFSEKEVSLSEALIAGRLLHPASELDTHRWLKFSSGLDEVVGFNYNKVSLASFYRVLDKLSRYSNKIEESLYREERSIFNFKGSLILYDLTNTYIEGGGDFNPIATYGRSKEHRSDCPLITLGLLLNEEGFPIKSKIFKGSVSEPTTLQSALKDIKKDMVNIGTVSPTIVMDAGITSEENITWLKDNGYTYVVVSRAKNIPFSNNNCEPIEIENKSYKVQGEIIKDEDETYLYVTSEMKEKKETSIKEKFTSRFEESLILIRSNLHKKGGVKNYDKVLERIHRLKERYNKISRFYNIEIIKDNIKPDRVIDITFSFDSEKAKNTLNGSYILRTNLTYLNSQSIFDLYMMLNNIESTFRSLKSELSIRPIYHRTRTRTDGHIFITVLAYHIVQAIRSKLKANGIHSSWKSIREILSTHSRVTILMKDRSGKIIRIRKTSRVEHNHKEIYSALNINTHNILKTIRR